MAVLSDEIDFEGTATVTAVTEGGTQLVPVETVAGGGAFSLPSQQLPVCGELLGLVLSGTISRDAGADNESIWVDVQVVGQARKAHVTSAPECWEVEASDGSMTAIAIPAGLSEDDVKRAEDADFWVFEGPVPGIEIPGIFTDLNGFLATGK